MGSAARLPTARPCPPATVLDFRARLARGRARAAREGKCWRFYPPADPLQAALRLAPLIIPMIDFIQSACGYSKRPRLTPRASPWRSAARSPPHPGGGAERRRYDALRGRRAAGARRSGSTAADTPRRLRAMRRLAEQDHDGSI